MSEPVVLEANDGLKHYALEVFTDAVTTYSKAFMEMEPLMLAVEESGQVLMEASIKAQSCAVSDDELLAATASGLRAAGMDEETIAKGVESTRAAVTAIQDELADALLDLDTPLSD